MTRQIVYRPPTHLRMRCSAWDLRWAPRAKRRHKVREAGRFEVTPYLWAAGIDGDIQFGRLPKTNVDQSFSDILDVLGIGVMGAFEARKDRWGFLFDAMYLKISDDASTPGPLFGDVEAIPDPKERAFHEPVHELRAPGRRRRPVARGRRPAAAPVGGLRVGRTPPRRYAREVARKMSATLTDRTGAFVLFGSCTPL
jgi:hypothetical protein